MEEPYTKKLTMCLGFQVDCTEETSLCADHEVTGFPTLKLFEKGGKSFKRYSGKRDLEALKNFVQENVLGLEKEVKEPKTLRMIFSFTVSQFLCGVLPLYT